MSEEQNQNNINLQHNKYEDKIKQDEQDLQRLSQHVGKVQKLKKQHTKQKQQISSLKNVILDLKSQNQELKSKSLKKQKIKKQQKKLNQQENLLSNSEEEKQIKQGQNQIGNIRHQSKSKSSNANKIKNKEHQTQFKSKAKPKLWNLTNEKYKNKRNLEIDDQTNRLLVQFIPQPSLSIRNHSGFISSTNKLLSPQARTQANTHTWRMFNSIHPFPYSSDQDQSSHLNSNHFKTKTKLVDDLFSDIQFQLNQVSQSLHTQKISHKATKNLLQQFMNQNKSLNQLNQKLSPLISTNQLLDKQNQYLKKQLYKLTQNKNTLQAELKQTKVNEQWYVEMNRKKWDEQQKQFRIMDQIYENFLDICDKIQMKKLNYGKYQRRYV